MWESPEAQSKLAAIRELIQHTLQHMRLAKARGTMADKTRATGIAVEVMFGIVETFEFGETTRHRVLGVVDVWLSNKPDNMSVSKLFEDVFIVLDIFSTQLESTP